jgi:hypothetical protein
MSTSSSEASSQDGIIVSPPEYNSLANFKIGKKIGKLSVNLVRNTETIISQILIQDYEISKKT